MSLLQIAARDLQGRGRRSGDGPGTTMTNVYFLHGVGMWPGLYEPFLERFSGVGLAPARPGYDDRPPAGGFAAQISGVRAMLAEHGPGVLVGVSGGATVALAAAVERVEGVEGVVTHEPLVGPLVPELHELVSAAAHDVHDGEPARIDAFLWNLYGPSWGDIGGNAERWVARHRLTVAREVAHFASFAPTLEALRSIAVPHVTTIGERSAQPRRDVADLLADCGAIVRTVPECGHLVPLENPAAFAAAIDDLLTRVGHPT